MKRSACVMAPIQAPGQGCASRVLPHLCVAGRWGTGDRCTRGGAEKDLVLGEAICIAAFGRLEGARPVGGADTNLDGFWRMYWASI